MYLLLVLIFFGHLVLGMEEPEKELKRLKRLAEQNKNIDAKFDALATLYGLNDGHEYVKERVRSIDFFDA